MQTGAEALKTAAASITFSSGSAAIDGLLGGGYSQGRLYEIFGKSNSGKTQLAMQAVLVAAISGHRALFVDTEGTFRPERLEGVAAKRGWDLGGALDRVVYVRTDSSAEQMELVKRMGARETTKACRLVVIDTLSRNFSVELPGRSNMSSRQEALGVHLSQMARDAYLNRRAYVLTNRVTFGATADVGIGGKTVEQLVHASVRLERTQGGVRATVVPSREQATASLGEGGFD